MDQLHILSIVRAKGIYALFKDGKTSPVLLWCLAEDRAQNNFRDQFGYFPTKLLGAILRDGSFRFAEIYSDFNGYVDGPKSTTPDRPEFATSPIMSPVFSYPQTDLTTTVTGVTTGVGTVEEKNTPNTTKSTKRRVKKGV